MTNSRLAPPRPRGLAEGAFKVSASTVRSGDTAAHDEAVVRDVVRDVELELLPRSGTPASIHRSICGVVVKNLSVYFVHTRYGRMQTAA
eukprot:SAG25_NODE_428_length_8143_cov_4.172178_4_plen_89_part_00